MSCLFGERIGQDAYAPSTRTRASLSKGHGFSNPWCNGQESPFSFAFPAERSVPGGSATLRHGQPQTGMSAPLWGERGHFVEHPPSRCLPPSPRLRRIKRRTGRTSNAENKKPLAEQGVENMERAMGIEPTCEAWEAPILPLNYARRNVG